MKHPLKGETAMKKFVCLVVTFGIMLSAVGVMPAAAEATSFNDMDYVLLLLQIVVSGEEFDEDCLSNFDLNGDGTVNSVDALIAAKEALGISEWSPRPKAPEALSLETENQIKQDWVNGYGVPNPDDYIDDVHINYYGTYNGYVAFYIEDNYHGYPGGMTGDVQMWKNGVFVQVMVAYGQGLITWRDLWDIKYYHNSEI